MDLFGSDLFSNMIICDSDFNIQELSVLLVIVFINLGVANQAPQVSLNFVVEDSMLVLSYEFSDIRFCELLDIYEAISDYGDQALSTVPSILYLWSHAYLLTELVKRKTFCIHLDTCY